MYRVIGFLCLLLLAACSSKTTEPTEQAQAATYFQEGEVAFENGLYQDAIASWEKVRDTYFSPELNALAELKIAEAQFLAENYLEASVAYEEFLKNHPDHARSADILYQLGIAYIKQMRNYDQDQTATRSALTTFGMLKDRFPDDPRNEEASIYIAYGMDQLAAHELIIAKFYLKTGYYSAAIGRLEGIFRQYPDFNKKDEAYFALGQAYFKNGDRDKATEVFERLFKEFAGSEQSDEARKFLDKNS
jgi:outer membrane protein assembly factor BamD